MVSVPEYVFYVFFRFKKRDLLFTFFKMTCHKVVSKSLVLSLSKSVHILFKLLKWNCCHLIWLEADESFYSKISCWIYEVTTLWRYTNLFIIIIIIKGDQKVLQFHTLINKMVKINYWVTITKYYLVINFWKNDNSFSVYDVIVTSL